MDGKEEGCEGATFERKYYRSGLSYIKRSLRPREFGTNILGSIHVPRLAKERLQNEADSLRFIRRMTDIPVPVVYADFEDDGAYYLITEFIDGVSMNELTEQDKAIVMLELNRHLLTLRNLKSKSIGGPSGRIVIPYRVMQRTDQDEWNLQTSEADEYVFCHNDLSEYNVIVNPKTLQIASIIDWEYAGFYPAFFEAPPYTRHGPRAQAWNDDPTNIDRMLEFLRSKEVSVCLSFIPVLHS